MLRTVAIAAAFGGCTLMGLRASDRLRRRRDLLTELVEAIRRLSLGIAHTGRPVSELLACCGGRGTGPLFLVMGQAVAAGETAAQAFREAAGDTGLLWELTERDRALLEDLFDLLGRSGRRAQLESIQGILEALARNQVEAAEAYGKKGRVYRSMGMLTGAGAAILLL